MYGTQVDAVAESIGRLLSDPQALGYEVAWATVAPERQRCAQGIVREVRGDPLDDRRRGGQARLLAGDH